MTVARRRRSIPRELRAIVKPWRETQEKEVRRAIKLAKGSKFLAAILLGISKTKVYRILQDAPAAKHVDRKNRARSRRRSR